MRTEGCSEGWRHTEVEQFFLPGDGGRQVVHFPVVETENQREAGLT